MKTLVIGLGNPILSDDGIGLAVCRSLRASISLPDVTIVETHIGGIRLLELMAGFDKVILIDAIQTKKGKAGKVTKLLHTDFEKTRHISSAHEISFFQAIDLGKRSGLILPEEISIIAIEADDVSTFSEECTPEVRKAIPLAVSLVFKEINFLKQ